MGEVRCLYSWDEKRYAELRPWVEADDQRYALFLETDPTKAVLQTPHPRIRFFFIPEMGREEVLHKIAGEFLFLPFSFDASDHVVLRQLREIQTKIAFQTFDFADQGIQLLKNIKSNLEHPFSCGSGLERAFTGVPAIVCGAGPSLHLCRAQVQKIQDTALVIGCGAGVEALRAFNIRPHFAAHVDPDPAHQFKGSDIPLLFQLRSAAKTVSLYQGRRILMPGAAHLPLEGWIQESLGLPPLFDGGWTVGTFGVAMAFFFGCNPITLVGLDGFTTQPGEGLSPAKNRQGIQGFSRPDWILAAEWLDNIAQQNPLIQWRTAGEHGLEMPSISPVRWEQIPKAPQISERVQRSLDNLLLAPGNTLGEEIFQSCHRSKKLCRDLLQEMEKIFPRHPHESGTCAFLEHDLYEEIFYQKVLDPVWAHWRSLICRHNTAGEWGVYLNKVLLFQSICLI